eukprot:4906912-Pyramimonas_sp.AAC.1
MGDADDSAPDAWKYGLVNVAAFLAQSMKETIKYDACDENNWDSTTGYPASNACGQLGQSYQVRRLVQVHSWMFGSVHRSEPPTHHFVANNALCLAPFLRHYSSQNYNCGPDDAHMQCEVDPDMEMRGTTHAKWYGAPPAFFCAPKSKMPAAPHWSTVGWCDPNVPRNTDKTLDAYLAYVQSGDKCEDYEGQKGGFFEPCSGAGCANAPAPNFGQPARTDVEGCCWWGRGVIQVQTFPAHLLLHLLLR